MNRPSPIRSRMKVMTLPWLWMVTEISTSLTIATMVVAICVCPAESMAFGKTKRLRAPLTLETTLTSQSIHRVRFTSYHSTPTTNIYLHSGTPGSWTAQTGLSGGNAHWPVVVVDSNDAVHISYHYGNTQKDVMYMTNASGSWSTASKIEGYGGWGSEMAIDDNDDIFHREYSCRTE